jgi:hypothetical protein
MLSWKTNLFLFLAVTIIVFLFFNIQAWLNKRRKKSASAQPPPTPPPLPRDDGPKTREESTLCKRCGESYVEVNENGVREVDRVVTAWAKRFLLFVLLLLGIPAAGFATYALILEDIQAKFTTQDVERKPGVCYKCGQIADGYWYSIGHPERGTFYVCSMHKYEDEVQIKLDPYGRLRIYGIIGLVLLISPFMLVKYRPRRLAVRPISSASAMGSPPGWFWLSMVFTTVLYPLAPVAFCIALQGRRAYQVGSPRRRWGQIALIWSGFVIVAVASLAVLIAWRFAQ